MSAGDIIHQPIFPNTNRTVETWRSEQHATMTKKPRSNRRDFLTGRAVFHQVREAGEVLAEGLASAPAAPRGGNFLSFSTRAMACDFSVLLNPGQGWLATFSDGLEQVHPLEQLMTIYRDDSEMSRVNREASSGEACVDPELWELLFRATKIAGETEGAFDPTSGPLVALWRSCREEGRIPTVEEVETSRAKVGFRHLELRPEGCSLRYKQPGLTLDLGGIGKGYALDRIGDYFRKHGETDWLLHGGKSSLLAAGSHNNTGGWPVSLRNPLVPREELATILLTEQAMATSGAGTRYFRYRGRRYGHILDPGTGWPVEGMLSVTVLAPTAEQADALSTAFFVMGLEKTERYCQNNPQVGALLIPSPKYGRQLEPVLYNIPEQSLFFHTP
jgi:FAD:protein FMN transferase